MSREIRETMALRMIIDNVKMNISHDSTIKIGIGIGDGAEDDNR